MSIDVTITDNSKEILTAEQEAIKKALIMIGIKAERFAKEDCPVDTGLLRNSITYALSGESPAQTYYQADRKKPGKEKEERGEYKGTVPNDKNLSLYIGTNVEYAFPNEDRKHFLRNSATTHSNLYKNIAKKALEGTTQ
jgi:hypothetical protein